MKKFSLCLKTLSSTSFYHSLCQSQLPAVQSAVLTRLSQQAQAQNHRCAQLWLKHCLSHLWSAEQNILTLSCTHSFSFFQRKNNLSCWMEPSPISTEEQSPWFPEWAVEMTPIRRWGSKRQRKAIMVTSNSNRQTETLKPPQRPCGVFWASQQCIFLTSAVCFVFIGIFAEVEIYKLPLLSLYHLQCELRVK